jgi:excinuclease ABC subunit A
VKTADWVLDLGPEGGDGGGRLVAAGTPEDIAANQESWTGKFLAETFRRQDERRAQRNRRDRAKAPAAEVKAAPAKKAKPKPAAKPKAKTASTSKQA